MVKKDNLIQCTLTDLLCVRLTLLQTLIEFLRIPVRDGLALTRREDTYRLRMEGGRERLLTAI